MTFLWPHALWSLLALPVLVAAYLWLLRRRRTVLSFPSLAVIREAIGARNVARHIPPALTCLALAVLMIASARPQMTIRAPGLRETIVLAIDVSASMQADDVTPTRIAAARRAAKTFVRAMPPDVSIAVVSFAAAAAVVQAPTLDRAQVEQAIDRLQVGPSTNMHAGIALSVATLFPQDGIEVEKFASLRARSHDAPVQSRTAGPVVAAGSDTSGAIVLLSDGQRTLGGDPIDAARLAEDRGVRIYTVGLGTTRGTVIRYQGYLIRVALDEVTLKQVARMTAGQYFNAVSAEELQTVYEGLGKRLAMESGETEVTALAAVAGALLVVVAAGLSIAWFGRAP